jgi:demethylmenaquinone methyltransferase / 2-methoxy-6-polyprenyl-1,4-benzoquinol methylase
LDIEKIKPSSYKLFDAVAEKYDRTNRLLSVGMDLRWRKNLKKHFPEKKNVWADIATGTGDQIFALMDKGVEVDKAIGIDLSEKMLEIGGKKLVKKVYAPKVHFTSGDALSLPLDDSSIDVATISFGIRNLPDPLKGLKEMARVLKSGGRALVLEFSLPENLLRKPYLFYLKHLLPRIGRLATKHDFAYSYLHQTIEIFPYGQKFCALALEAGFRAVAVKTFSFGAVSLYIADK